MEPSNDNNVPPGRTRGLSALFRNAAQHPFKTALKLIGLYLWPPAARWDNPFSREGAKHKFRRFLRGTAAVGIVLAGHQVVHSTTGMLFPTAEDYLQSQGLDPRLAAQVSDNTIRVRQHDFWGRLHAANDLPSAGALLSWMMINTPGQAHAIPNHDSLFNYALRYTPLHNFVQCPVMLQAPDTTARDSIAMLGDIAPGQIERIRVTDEQMRMAVAFHEFRHCASGNALEGVLAEGEADGTGVVTYARAVNNPDIALTVLYARALGRDAHGHDTALVMDSMMRGRPVPADEDAALRPSRDVFALAGMFARQRMAASPLSEPLKTAVALTHVMRDYGDLLSPRAQRRAQLYIEAVAYFMPDAWERARAAPLNRERAPAPR